MNIEYILYRILLGYYYITVNDKKYKVKYPTAEIKYESEILYQETFEDNKFNSVYMNESEIKKYLLFNNIWSEKDEEKIKKTEKLIEDTKVNLYLQYSNTKKRSTFKKNIENLIQDLNRLQVRKHSFDYLTIKEHAMSVKNEFIIMNTIYDLKGNLIFNSNNIENSKYNILQNFIQEILSNNIHYDDLRKLAKSDLWKSHASCMIINKNELPNDDYRHLVNLHKMYDNVRQHPECPSEEIINDDYALDGWFIYNNNKNEKEKKKNDIVNKIGTKNKNHNEQFIVTDDIDETKEIFSLNDPAQTHNIREIQNKAKKLQKNESVPWAELDHVKREIKQKIKEKK